MNVHLYFLVCLHIPFAVTTVVGFLDLLEVSSSSKLNSFLVSMCFEAPESTTRIRSSVFLETRTGVFIFPQVSFLQNQARKDFAQDCPLFG